MKILYTAEATSEGGRFEARAFSSDGRLDVAIEPPPDLGGPQEGNATNPEQLFAAGYAACFHSAMKTIAGMKKIEMGGSLVRARVGLGFREDGGGFGLETELHVDLPDLDAEAAEKLVHRAYRRCPYSNVTRGNMPTKLFVNGAELAPEPARAPEAAS